MVMSWSIMLSLGSVFVGWSFRYLLGWSDVLSVIVKKLSGFRL